jgi:hypothetical protein
MFVPLDADFPNMAYHKNCDKFQDHIFLYCYAWTTMMGHNTFNDFIVTPLDNRAGRHTRRQSHVIKFLVDGGDSYADIHQWLSATSKENTVLPSTVFQ